ncbi:hypothetical protein F4779DRAFT_100616 [Xylariaceae sp. FL0662B]|nr:hypothetical protein F4779DRAFT_100616 [Xylariaceae sp. FL0662B]
MHLVIIVTPCSNMPRPRRVLGFCGLFFSVHSTGSFGIPTGSCPNFVRKKGGRRGNRVYISTSLAASDHLLAKASSYLRRSHGAAKKSLRLSYASTDPYYIVSYIRQPGSTPSYVHGAFFLRI